MLYVLIDFLLNWTSIWTDYSTGFGGKYGVQTDRVDEVMFINVYRNSSAVCFRKFVYFFLLFHNISVL